MTTHTRSWLLVLVAGVGLLTLSRIAEAQLAPTDDHYAGRQSDTGYAGSVNAAGSYAAVVPLELPPARGGIAVPVQIVFGGHVVGAAGVGWDVPLSYLRVDTSIVKRKPRYAPHSAVQGRRHVSVSIGGQTMTLVPKANAWVSQSDNAMFSATQDGNRWIATDGLGHELTFEEPPGYTGVDLWLLKSISSSAGTMMTFDYEVGSVALAGGHAASIDLVRVSYNYNPALGCAKDVVELEYGPDAATPLALSVMPSLIVRRRTIDRVNVRMRASCSSIQTVRSYAFSYTPDVDTQQPRLDRVVLYGRDGTTEASAALPVATYHYGSASTNGKLIYEKAGSIDIPDGADNHAISHLMPWLPGLGPITQYATLQTLTDVTGDGVPDWVFPKQDKMWIAKGRTTSAPVPLGDTPTAVGVTLAQNELSRQRLSDELTANTSDAWRQMIDINGDGRVDLIDAAARADAWTVYLNTQSSGASGVAWEERIIPTKALRERLEMYGHKFTKPGRLPLSRHYTAREYTTSTTGEVTKKQEFTYTEWELKDINADGLPDLVFDTQPVQMRVIPTTGSDGAPNGEEHIPMPGPSTNSVMAMFNLSAVTMSGPTGTPYNDVYSTVPVLLVEKTTCGVEMWDGGWIAPSTTQFLECSFVDITGDGVPERIDHEKAYIGLGAGFSGVYLTLPQPESAGRHVQEHESCFGKPATATFNTWITGGIRDVTGDGIPDLIGALGVYPGTGFGFGTKRLTMTGVGSLSAEVEQCDGLWSGTVAGMFDLDGDGRADYVQPYEPTRLSTMRLTSGTGGGTPDQGQLTNIDNGYGASVVITYRSAKGDWSSRHDVPFPEVVVDSVRMQRAKEKPGDALLATKYAYGDASLAYDNIADAFVFTGYRRTVALQAVATATQNATARGPASLDHSIVAPPTSVGQATITDTYGPPDYSYGTPVQRYAGHAIVGRPSSVLVLAGDVGTDAWAWLAADTANDRRQTSRTTYKYASDVVVEQPTDGEALLDCLDWPNPYNYDATIGDAMLGYDTCSSHGFTYVAETLLVRGAPTTTDANTWTKTRVLKVDTLGRATKVAYDNDVFRDDDDICVETTYAEPVADSIPTLGAPRMRRIGATCDRETPTLHAEAYEWDALTPGYVSAGFLTSKTVEYFATDTGTSLRKVRVFDGTYDAVGNLVHSISVREEDGAYRETALTYDAFALAVVKSEISGTNVAPQTTSVKYDLYTLDPLIATDENGAKRALGYDGFQRIVRTSIASTESSSFAVTSKSTYTNFEAGTSDRTIAVTTFDTPVAADSVSSATGHTEITYLDELGRAYRRESTLGGDYGNAVLVTAYRTYDPFGRVSFDAEPFLATESPDTAFGTSRYFQPDGTPNCFVRAHGPHALTAISDPASDVYAECYYHGYANHLESSGTSGADANTPGSPQAGVMRMQTATAIGRVLSRVTVRSSERLDSARYAQDRFGNTTLESRFLLPAFRGGYWPVARQWRYDSAGRVLEEIAPEGQRTRNEYDSWGELTGIVSSDPAASPAIDHRIQSQYDALGRLVHRDERHGGIIDPETVNEYRYDAGYRPSSLVEPTFTVGRMTMASAPSGTSYFSYDAYGAQNATVWIDQGGHNYVEKVEHAVDGRMLSMDMYLPDLDYAQEHVEFLYDSDRQLSSAQYESPTQSRTLYQVAQRDPYGRVLNATYGAATFTSNYATTGRRLLQSAEVSSSSGTRRYTFGSYDAIGRELTRSEQVDNDAPVVMTQSYDALGRLATSTRSQGSVTSASWAFGYDALGNIVGSLESVSGRATQMSYRSGDRDQLCSIGFPDTNTPCSVTHDYAGNVTSMPTKSGPRSLDYFLSGRLRRIGNRTEKATFRYNALGALQQLDVEAQGDTSASSHPPDARHDEHFGNIEVHRSTGSGNNVSFVARTIPGPGVSVTLRGGTTADWLYAIGDGRGLRTTVDSSGDFVQDVNYTPYGEATSTGAEVGSELYTHDQWNGGDALADFGLSHLNARVYDPAIGRFLSRDPLRVMRTAAASNPYSFGANDPINHSDPSGRDWGDTCMGQECQWYNPIGIVGAIGGLLGLGHHGGSSATPPPPSMPPTRGGDGSACEFADASAGCGDSMFPTWRSPGFWGRVSQGAHAFGRAWVRAGDKIRDTAAAAFGFVDAHKKYFIAAAVFVVVATTQPELIVADLVTGGGIVGSIIADAPAEDAAVSEAGAATAADAAAVEEAYPAAYDEAQLIEDGFTRRAPSPDDAEFATQDEALAEALRRHGIDPDLVESTPKWGRDNPNLVGPKGQPWYKMEGLDANGTERAFDHHANGHVFTDNNTYELPHYHGPDGEHITYPW